MEALLKSALLSSLGLGFLLYCYMLQAWQNWEMKNLIFVIKLWYLMSRCIPDFAYVHRNTWGKRARGEVMCSEWVQEREAPITYNIFTMVVQWRVEANCQISKISKGSEGHEEGAWEKEMNLCGCLCLCEQTLFKHQLILSWLQKITHSLLCCCCCEVQCLH